MDKLVIAEGVENAEQENFLILNGCYLAQGYYYSKPLESEVFLSFLESNEKKRTRPRTKGNRQNRI